MNPRYYLDVAIYQVEAPGPRQGLEIVRHVAGPDSLVIQSSELVLPSSHDIPGRGKRRSDLPVHSCDRSTSGVIEVEMRCDDDIDFARLDAEVRQRCFEPRRIPIVGHSIDGLELVALLVAQAGVDQHGGLVRLHKQTTHRERYPVPLVTGRSTIPQRLRNDTEHGPTVEPQAAGVHRPDPAPTSLKTRRLTHATSRGRRSGSPELRGAPRANPRAAPSTESPAGRPPRAS